MIVQPTKLSCDALRWKARTSCCVNQDQVFGGLLAGQRHQDTGVVKLFGVRQIGRACDEPVDIVHDDPQAFGNRSNKIHLIKLEQILDCLDA